MSFKDIVNNSTDSNKTLYSNLLSKFIFNIYFNLILYSEFNYYIILFTIIDQHSLINIFNLFFILE
jgi:hypothetical protein